ncbi:MAG: amino acid--[acyl-carrier-protein] ligase [Minicystis sp.]
MHGRTFSADGFRAELVQSQLIVPLGVPGAFGRGAVFEDVLGRFDAILSRFVANDGAEKMLLPPIMSRDTFEKSGYLDSFPHLAGAVSSFVGTDAEHHALAARAREQRPWGELLTMTEVVLAPAACYSVYPLFAGAVPGEGRLVDAQSWVFRHEPSPEPTRMQSFRMRELVRVGAPDQVLAWRDAWVARGLELLGSLGLPATVANASDPFFGRGGRMLSSSQREQQLKFEIVVPIISEASPTAVCSFNYHQDHFGAVFGIRTLDGQVAHSACLGFGMERVTMALFKTHGLVPAEWPIAVRERLWP